MDFQSLYELYQNYRKLPHGSERAERIHDAIAYMMQSPKPTYSKTTSGAFICVMT